MSLSVDSLIPTLKRQFATPRQVVAIGSTSFWGKSTQGICEATGRQLAKLKDVAILTGGVSGVPEAISHSFWQQRREQGEEKPPVFHIQPAGFTPWDYGENLTAGYTLEQRRWVLAHLAPVYLLLEGGPGAAQEVRWALAAGAIVIPVGCTGGFASNLYGELRYSQWVASENVEAAWEKIADPVPPFPRGVRGDCSWVAEIATAIVTLLQKALDLNAKQLDRAAIEARLARDDRNFQGCWIENARLDGLNLRGVNFRWAIFKQVNFGRTDLSEANLRGSLMFGCRFERAIVTKTQFNYAHFVRTTFHNTDLPTADLTATCCWASWFQESVASLLEKLEAALKSARWHRGNQLTLRLLFALTGGVKKDDGETFNPELPGCLPYNRLEISQSELLAIDFLWFHYAQGRFGFSVQAHIWRSLLAEPGDNIYIDVDKDKAFADRVGRPQFLPLYQADRAEFSLDCPAGHLPWLNWVDTETGSLCGLMGGGRGRDLIFFLEPQLPAGLEAFVFVSAIKNSVSPLRKLEEYLLRGQWSKADRLTYYILTGWRFLGGGLTKLHWSNLVNGFDSDRFDEIPEELLLEVDRLWSVYSQGHFGFKVQLEIWETLPSNSNPYSDPLAAFARQIGRERPDFDVPYNLHQSKFSKASPKGHLPWMYWQEGKRLGGGTIDPKGDRRLEPIGHPGFRNRLINCQKILQQQNLPPRILIVDDSITVRHLLSMTFTKAGYRIIAVRDGQEAWELLQAGVVCDLIFADTEMPRMNGLELLEKLKKDRRLQQIPVAMITSRGEDKMRPVPLWQSLGAVACFRKPYVEETLLNAVAQILRKSYS